MPEIFQAESERISGKYAQSILTLRQDAEIDPNQITHLTAEELQGKMMLWRIWVVNLGSLANATPFGNTAANYLKESNQVIQTYYHHPTTIEAASQMTQDPQGDEYFMQAEMSRDQAKHCLKVAALTGNTQLVKDALSHLDQAIESAPAGSSAHHLSQLEKQIAAQKLGQKIDPDSFTHHYSQVSQIASSSQNWDRLASVSHSFLQHLPQSVTLNTRNQAHSNLIHAVDNLKQNLTLNYRLKSFIGSIFQFTRRKTFNQNAWELDPKINLL